jgi:hypothetical protein
VSQRNKISPCFYLIKFEQSDCFALCNQGFSMLLINNDQAIIRKFFNCRPFSSHAYNQASLPLPAEGFPAKYGAAAARELAVTAQNRG